MTRFAFPKEILPAHKAILGMTGSGKTSTAKLLIEQVVTEDDARVCILDTTKSDWWGLISSADGKKPGLPFHILGGPRGHVPLHSSAGRAIAEIVASGALRHSIIDMADFEAGGIQRFFVDFAPVLLRNMKGVLYLVIEEAHEIAPKEKVGFDKENMAVHYAKKLATAGRTRGLRLLVLTQRVQALHNALLGSCQVMIAHRLTAPADQEPVIKWLKANTPKAIAETVSQDLARLKTGRGWLISGNEHDAKGIDFPRIKTYDNTATPEGDDEEHQVKTAPVDPEKLRAIIGDAVKQAEAKDPARLQAEISRLKAELAKKALPAAAAADPKALEQAERRGYERGIAEGIRDFDQHHRHLLNTEGHLHDAREAVQAVRLVLEDWIHSRRNTTKFEPRPQSSKPEDLRRRPPPGIRRESVPAGERSNLPAGELAIMKAVAQHEGCGRDQLSVLTGYKRSTRNTYIQRLEAKGFVQLRGDEVLPTEEGIAALGADFEPLPTGQALQDHWIARLPEGERAILQIVLEQHPNAVAREHISGTTGYKRSTRNTYIQRLVARRLVDTTGDDVRASEVFFQ